MIGQGGALLCKVLILSRKCFRLNLKDFSKHSNSVIVSDDEEKKGFIQLLPGVPWGTRRAGTHGVTLYPMLTTPQPLEI